jgi:membrane-associated phospholipid phosphatase
VPVPDKDLPTIVSALTTPYLTTPLFILLAGLYYVKDPGDILLYGAIAVTFTVAVPLVYTELLRRTGRVESVHVFDQRARLGPLVLTGVSSVVGFLILYLVGAPGGILRLGAMLFLLAGALVGATWFLKLSGHVAGWTAGTTVLVALYGPPAALLYAVALPIAWSRLALGKHTGVEVVAGLLYGVAITAAFVWLVGLR